MKELLFDSKFCRGTIQLHNYVDEDLMNGKDFAILQAAWKCYKLAASMYWVVEQLDFSQDEKGYELLNASEKHVVERILAFFANSDSIINIGLNNLIKKITLPEVRAAYIFQEAIETVHGECYAAMIENLTKNKVKQQELFDSVTNDPIIRKISEWVLRHIYGVNWTYEEFLENGGEISIDMEKNLHRILLGMVCMEGIVFSGAFLVIYWLREHKDSTMTMKGLFTSNDYICRDEKSHTDFAMLMCSLVKNRLPKSEVHKIIREMVEIAKEFNSSAIKGELVGLSKEGMNAHTESIADLLSSNMGYGKIYGSVSPYDFMNKMNLRGADNFFESTITDYQHVSHSSNDVIFNSKPFDPFCSDSDNE